MQAANRSCANSERFNQPHTLRRDATTVQRSIVASSQFQARFTWKLSQATSATRCSIISVSLRAPPAWRRPMDRIFPSARECARARPCRPCRPPSAVIRGLFFVAAMRPLALGVSGHREQRQNERRNRENLHRPCSLRHSLTSSCNGMMAIPGSVLGQDSLSSRRFQQMLIDGQPSAARIDRGRGAIFVGPGYKAARWGGSLFTWR